jgi:hypothetical protein
MIGSYRSSNLDASFSLFTLGMLILTEVFRLDQEVALVSVYLPLHVPTDRKLVINSYHC